MRRMQPDGRLAILGLLLTLVLALSVHGPAMIQHSSMPNPGSHGEPDANGGVGDMAVVLCFAIVMAGVAGAALVRPRIIRWLAAPIRSSSPPSTGTPLGPSRHPPDEGTVLRL